MTFYYIKKENKHIVISFLFIKFKFKIKLRKKYSSPILVIIGAYGIGDYILYRHFFKYIKLSDKFKDASVFYIARNIYSDFVRTYDSQYFDEIFDYNPEKSNSFIYNKLLAAKINSYKPDALFSLTPLSIYNNKLNCPSIIKYLCFNIKSKEKYISFFGKKNEYDLKNFNHIIYFDYSKSFLFEKERIRKEFENLLEIKIPDDCSEIKTPLDTIKKRIALSVCASDKTRMLKLKYWVEIINFINEVTDINYEIIFLGTKTEEKFIKTLIGMINKPERCINMAGKLSISLIPIILKSCEFLVSVESGNVHIAHDVGCKTICLSGSYAYGRFHPYNDNVVTYIYPEKFIDYLNSMPQGGNVYTPPRKDFSVNDIYIDVVKKTVKKLI